MPAERKHGIEPNVPRFTSAAALRDFLATDTVPTGPNRLVTLGDPALTRDESAKPRENPVVGGVAGNARPPCEGLRPLCDPAAVHSAGTTGQR
nr:hypothetical protein OG999_01490 [Streptomyces sp. NBC_00886]